MPLQPLHPSRKQGGGGFCCYRVVVGPTSLLFRYNDLAVIPQVMWRTYGIPAEIQAQVSDNNTQGVMEWTHEDAFNRTSLSIFQRALDLPTNAVRSVPSWQRWCLSCLLTVV